MAEKCVVCGEDIPEEWERLMYFLHAHFRCESRFGKPVLVRGYFEYQDPYEPVGFYFDDDIKEELGDGIWELGGLIKRLAPGWDKNYESRRSKRFALVVIPIE
jgi:hypothetical protein